MVSSWLTLRDSTSGSTQGWDPTVSAQGGVSLQTSTVNKSETPLDSSVIRMECPVITLC